MASHYFLPVSTRLVFGILAFPPSLSKAEMHLVHHISVPGPRVDGCLGHNKAVDMTKRSFEVVRITHLQGRVRHRNIPTWPYMDCARPTFRAKANAPDQELTYLGWCTTDPWLCQASNISYFPLDSCLLSLCHQHLLHLAGRTSASLKGCCMRI